MQKDVAVEVNGEMAAILQSSRFAPDFKIQISDKPEPSSESTPDQVSWFTVANMLSFWKDNLWVNIQKESKYNDPRLACKNQIKRRFPIFKKCKILLF